MGRAPAVAHRVAQRAVRLLERWRIVRGDLVEVIAGKDKGKQGKVIAVDRAKNRLIVEGANLQKRHVKPDGERPGGILRKEGALHYSNVLLVDPVSKRGVRIATRFLEDGTKVRISKASGAVIPKPKESLLKRKKYDDQAHDTPPDVVTLRTYFDDAVYPKLEIVYPKFDSAPV